MSLMDADMDDDEYEREMNTEDPHVGAAPGSEPADEAGSPVAPETGLEPLYTAADIVDAIHAGEVPFLEAPLGWLEWLRWRSGPGRRDRSTRNISRLESQIWQQVMRELFGADWRLSLRALGPYNFSGGNAAAGVAAPAPSRPIGPTTMAALGDRHPDAASDGGRTEALSEGSWADLADHDLQDFLRAPLLPQQSLQDFERKVLRAQATLLLRQQEVDAAVVEASLAGARILDAARQDSRGAVLHLEERLSAELDGNNNDGVIDILVNMLQAARLADGSPGLGLRELVAPLSRGQATTLPARRLFASERTLEGEPRADGRSAPQVLRTSSPPGLRNPSRAPASEDGSSDSPEHPSMAGALDKLASILERQTTKQGEKHSTITVKPTISWPTLGDGDVDVDNFIE